MTLSSTINLQCLNVSSCSKLFFNEKPDTKHTKRVMVPMN